MEDMKRGEYLRNLISDA